MRLLQYNKTRKGSVQPNSPDLTNALRFYWTTDIHIKESVDSQPNATGAIGGNRYYYASMTKLKKMITEANISPLKAFLITGDMFEDSQDFTFFMTEWNKIDASMRKELTIGNHDLVAATGQIAYDNCVSGLGYSGRNDVAGSKFNQSFSLTNGAVSVRVLMVDSNFNSSGGHESTVKGFYTQAVLDWLQTEMANCDEQVILLMTHMLPHNYDIDYFDQTSAFAIRDIVESLKVSQPSKIIHCLGGHYHQSTVKTYENLGSNFKGYLGEALCLYEASDYMIVNVLPSKELYFEYKRVAYS